MYPYLKIIPNLINKPFHLLTVQSERKRAMIVFDKNKKVATLSCVPLSWVKILL